MDKTNIIVSIIIVLCIAAVVAAYGITNSNNPVFSDLASMGANDDTGDGIGNNTGLTVNDTEPISTSGSANTGSSSSGSTPSSSGSSGSSSSNSGSSSGSSSSSSSSGSSSSGSSSSSNSNSKSIISKSTAQSIALNAAPDSSYYVQSSSYSDGIWYVGVGNGTAGYGFEVEIDAYTGKIVGGGGGAP